MRPRRSFPASAPAVQRMRAWLLLVAAVALHVLDEALTGFLDTYNPLVLSIRSRLPWFPAPTFTFGMWLGGLIAAVVGLALLAPMVRRTGPAVRAACWVFSGLMLLNGCGHLGGSIYFGRWLPGSTSAPLLIVASILLARRARRSPLDQNP